MSKPRKFAVLILLLLAPAAAHAQTSPYLQLSWVPPNGCVNGTTNCTPVTSFIILRGAASMSETTYQTVPLASLVTCATGTPPGNTQCWNDTNVVSGNSYFYRVEAVNQSGASAASNEASAAVGVVLTPPNPVGSLTTKQP
jgi:hypothetical protein